MEQSLCKPQDSGDQRLSQNNMLVQNRTEHNQDVDVGVSCDSIQTLPRAQDSIAYTISLPQDSTENPRDITETPQDIIETPQDIGEPKANTIDGTQDITGSSPQDITERNVGQANNGVAKGLADQREVHLWAAVARDSNDFTSWIHLLQNVEQKGVVGPAREAFDAFLKLYPYCYGYWKKYADLEQRRSGEEKAREVLERAVLAFPVSVDLWLHYTKLAGNSCEGSHEAMRRLFVRAVDACGLDYRSGQLWDAFIQLEEQRGSLQDVLRVYDAVLAIPIQGYEQYFQKFKEYTVRTAAQLVGSQPEADGQEGVACNSLEGVASDGQEGVASQHTAPSTNSQAPTQEVSIDGQEGVASTDVQEGVASTDVQESVASTDVQEGVVSTDVQEGVASTDVQEGVASADVQEGVASTDVQEGVASTDVQEGVASTDVQEGVASTDVQEGVASTDVQEGVASTDVQEGVASTDVQEGVASTDSQEGVASDEFIERRLPVFEQCMVESKKRLPFEEGIKRPYFHVKPLEKSQLRNWKAYLEFEISEGNQRRILFLFERCMVACALYEEFWSKYIKYAEEHAPDFVESVYQRACTIHLPKKPNIHLNWAAFEECRGNVERARSILLNIEAAVPALVMVRLRRIGLEVRQRCYEEAERLFLDAICSAEGVECKNFYSWRYARFANKLLQDREKASCVMQAAVQRDRNNSALYLQWLDMETSHWPVQEEAIDRIYAAVLESDLPVETKHSFAIRRAQCFEEFGCCSVLKLIQVQDELHKTRKCKAGSKRSGEEVTSNVVPKKAKEGQEQDVQAQQWALYQQQQWGAYNFQQGQGSYGFQQWGAGYQQYPFPSHPSY